MKQGKCQENETLFVKEYYLLYYFCFSNVYLYYINVDNINNAILVHIIYYNISILVI